MTRNTKIGIAVVGTLGALFTYRYFRNKYLYKQIIESIQGGVDQYGDLRDFQAYFSGKQYLDSLNASWNYIMLDSANITKYRKQLHDAIDGAGTNEALLKSVFNQLKDGVQIAQVSQSYLTNYKENLLDAITGDIGLSGSDAKDLYNIILTKPKYRK